MTLKCCIISKNRKISDLPKLTLNPFRSYKFSRPKKVYLTSKLLPSSPVAQAAKVIFVVFPKH